MSEHAFQNIYQINVATNILSPSVNLPVLHPMAKGYKDDQPRKITAAQRAFRMQKAFVPKTC